MSGFLMDELEQSVGFILYLCLIILVNEVFIISQITNNSICLKKINQELIKQALKMKEQGTKSMIARATGLNMGTCGNILNEFIETGKIIESELEKPNSGGHARRYVYNANFAHIACLYVSQFCRRPTFSYLCGGEFNMGDRGRGISRGAPS
ncbi:hypothetical protein ACQKP0_20935 [Heyndrickxia sp. NPDC080065]|uniref:hypothetical protein n=1 Tax=Heyndrickxia sp. NPDC080065 TaxID=3390568 RepID=UPI003D06D775